MSTITEVLTARLPSVAQASSLTSLLESVKKIDGVIDAQTGTDVEEQERLWVLIHWESSDKSKAATPETILGELHADAKEAKRFDSAFGLTNFKVEQILEAPVVEVATMTLKEGVTNEDFEAALRLAVSRFPMRPKIYGTSSGSSKTYVLLAAWAAAGYVEGKLPSLARGSAKLSPLAELDVHHALLQK